jgi:hypothetical protein
LETNGRNGESDEEEQAAAEKGKREELQRNPVTVMRERRTHTHQIMICAVKREREKVEKNKTNNANLKKTIHIEIRPAINYVHIP